MVRRASGAGQWWRVSPKAFRYLALASVVSLSALIVSGGAVRLTDSGLGCPDWPTCTQGHFVAPLQFHALVEFVNRITNLVLSGVLTATAVAAWLRSPRRRDLLWLTAGLLIGVLVQIVLGGLVVLFKLSPVLVMGHFLAAVAMVGDALLLYHRSGIEPTRGVPMVRRELVWLSRLTLATVALVITVGTAVTGSGPHAGSSLAARLPFQFRAVAELHADIVLFLIGLTLATQFALRVVDAPQGVQHRAMVMLEMMVAQGALGYTQYFLHVPAVLVEFHLLGATLVFIFAMRYHLGLFAHPPLSELADEKSNPVALVSQGA